MCRLIRRKSLGSYPRLVTKNEIWKIFLRRLPLNRFLAKTLKVIIANIFIICLNRIWWLLSCKFIHLVRMECSWKPIFNFLKIWCHSLIWSSLALWWLISGPFKYGNMIWATSTIQEVPVKVLECWKIIFSFSWSSLICHLTDLRFWRWNSWWRSLRCFVFFLPYGNNAKFMEAKQGCVNWCFSTKRFPIWTL